MRGIPLKKTVASQWRCYPVFAGDWEVTITSNDQMKFDQQVMSIPKSCSTFRVTLHHAGKLPKLVMGHNLVIVKKSDLDAVANDAMAAVAGNSPPAR